MIWFVRLQDGTCEFNSVEERILLRLSEYLTQNRLRTTSQRRTMAWLVTKIESPFCADALIDFYRKQNLQQQLSTATIYRTLLEFVDAGILASENEAGVNQYALI